MRMVYPNIKPLPTPENHRVCFEAQPYATFKNFKPGTLRVRLPVHLRHQAAGDLRLDRRGITEVPGVPPLPR